MGMFRPYDTSKIKFIIEKGDQPVALAIPLAIRDFDRLNRRMTDTVMIKTLTAG